MLIKTIFGINDPLAGVQTVVSGQKIGKGDRRHIIQRTVKSEQFTADQERRDRTVCDTAKHAAHADCRTECGRKADDLPEDTSEGSADKKRRNDLSALIPCNDRKHRKQDHSSTLLFVNHLNMSGRSVSVKSRIVISSFSIFVTDFAG